MNTSNTTNKPAFKVTYCGKSFVSRINELSELSIEYFNYEDYKHNKEVSTKLEKIITPKFGKILCFETPKDLLKWNDYWNRIRDNFEQATLYFSELQVISGLAINVEYPELLAKDNFNFVKFWENKKNHIPTIIAPKGTISCDAFKIETIYSFKDFANNFTPLEKPII